MPDTPIKNQLIKHLNGGEAFTPIGKFVEEISYHKLGVRPQGLPYSFYEVFYHIVYAQKDILDFCTAQKYTHPNWPEEYWPNKQKPESKEDWESLKESFFKDRKQLIDFVTDSSDILEPVKNGDDQTLLRELLLVIEHNAYHTGQLALILRLLGLHN